MWPKHVGGTLYTRRKILLNVYYMHLLVESAHRISLMHGHELFRIDLIKLFFSFFLLSLTSFYLAILGAEGYCCT